MAGSLKTTFFNLVKYAANDITSWLTDFNGNMDKIDAGMEANKQAAAAADDKATNAATSVAAITEIVQGNTDSIEANEKAIAANKTAIENLQDDFSGIDIGTLIYLDNSNSTVSIVEPLCTRTIICGRNIGGLYSGTLSLRYTAGNFHSYDRNADIPGMDNAYITDIIRITGNPFGLKGNSWTRLLAITGQATSGSPITNGNYVIGYLESSNFTIIGFSTNSSTPVEATATDVFASI